MLNDRDDMSGTGGRGFCERLDRFTKLGELTGVAGVIGLGGRKDLGGLTGAVCATNLRNEGIGFSIPSRDREELCCTRQGLVVGVCAVMLHLK